MEVIKAKAYWLSNSKNSTRYAEDSELICTTWKQHCLSWRNHWSVWKENGNSENYDWLEFFSLFLSQVYIAFHIDFKTSRGVQVPMMDKGKNKNKCGACGGQDMILPCLRFHRGIQLATIGNGL